MASQRVVAPTAHRVPWVDHLRVVAIAGVIVVHSATAYVTDLADWYYDDELEASVVGFAVFAVPALLGGIFGLGPLFWLAGWFSVPSLRRRGPAGFALSRATRLGLPLVAFVVVVNPLADLLGDVRHGPRSFWSYLVETELSVMWFVAALIACSWGYAGLRAFVTTPPHPRVPGTAAHLTTALAVGVLAVALWPVSSLLDEHLMSMRPGAWLQGAALFALGVAAGEAAPEEGEAADPRVSRRAERTWGWVTLGGLLAVMLLLGPFSAGDLADALHQMPWQGVVFALAYGVVSVSFSLWALGWFHRRWTRDRAWSRVAGRASYATYLIHPLVLTGVMIGLAWVPGGAAGKFVLVAAVGVPVCFATGIALARMPGLRRVL